MSADPSDDGAAHDLWAGTVFVSSALFPRKKQGQGLIEVGITTILDLSCGDKYPVPAGIARHAFPIEDRADTDIAPLFQQCHALIDQCASQEGKVLVHCAMGASRSATIVIAWLMTRQGMDLRTALNHCKSRRQAVRPNNGFFRVLRRLDQDLHQVDSMPLSAEQYIRWCLEHPRGEQSVRRHKCACIIL
jgi:protein-tyrosine phosphatase